MRTRPPRNRLAAGCLATVAAALALAGTTSGARAPGGEPESWRTAFEPRPEVEVGGRQIVVLAAPALADRVARTGALPPPKAQRRLVRRAESFQRRLVASLRRQGVDIRIEQSYTRTFNGFSAVLDATAAAALERAPGVVGVYPVRPVFPASLEAETLARATVGTTGLASTGWDGDGVTIALLDTGVDRSHPALEGRVKKGIDLVDGGDAEAERHGTRMAGLLVGRAPLAGAAPGATVLPIRVLGPLVGEAGPAYGGRTDVLLAGIERAVDPDGDGDVEDAARIALAALSAPFAGFPDGPEARAAAGASRLGTLLVAAAGNDGPGTLGFGTVGAPAGAAAALSVGALDTRPERLEARIRLTAGERELYAGPARVLGALVPQPGLEIADDSLALVPADGTPVAPRIRDAVGAGAAAILVYGAGLPAGSLDLDERAAVPVLAVPLEPGRAAAEALAGGGRAALSIEAVERRANEASRSVAPFSSGGTISAGAVKPDLVAPGVALPTADVGGGFATVTGSSAAAAVAAGVAAQVAQARADLDAAELAGVLVGTAEAGAGSVGRAGSGAINPGAALGARLAVVPASAALALEEPSGRATRALEVRNLSGERLRVRFAVEADAGATLPVAVETRPRRLTLGPGESGEVVLRVSSRASQDGSASGVLVAHAGGRELARIPWAVTAEDARGRLVRVLGLTERPAAKGRPLALLTFRAGAVDEGAGGLALTPVALLEAELRNAAGKRLGVLARFRDLLPGRYVLGLTGRGPTGRKLPAGRYVVRLLAYEASAVEGQRSPVSVDSAWFTVPRR